MVTEIEFLNRSHELESSLTSGNLLEYCDHKISVESNQNEKLLWQFLRVSSSSMFFTFRVLRVLKEAFRRVILESFWKIFLDQGNQAKSHFFVCKNPGYLFKYFATKDYVL